LEGDFEEEPEEYSLYEFGLNFDGQELPVFFFAKPGDDTGPVDAEVDEATEKPEGVISKTVAADTDRYEGYHDDGEADGDNTTKPCELVGGDLVPSCNTYESTKANKNPGDFRDRNEQLKVRNHAPSPTLV
jgi:hypothetical protein